MSEEHRLINTYDQLVAAGGGVAIVSAYTPGRTQRVCGWAVYRVNAQGQQVVTDKNAAWYDHGQKTFKAADKADALEEAKAWIAKHLGESGPWVRNARRDYVPERIQKQFPIPKRPKD